MVGIWDWRGSALSTKENGGRGEVCLFAWDVVAMEENKENTASGDN